MIMQQFTAANARPLPVILMLDTSGSMSVNGNIDAMTQAVNNMIKSFSQESQVKAEIQLSIITFGGNTAELHTPLTPVALFAEDDKPLVFQAKGMTPLGSALELVQALIEDKEQIPNRAYKPTIVLVSDGYPNDSWQDAFTSLQNSERAKKAVRMAMAIGREADEDMLTSFINDPETPLFRAENSTEIQRFFRAVSISVRRRSGSNNPNQVSSVDYAAVEDEMFDDLEG